VERWRDEKSVRQIAQMMIGGKNELVVLSGCALTGSVFVHVSLRIE
jgi:hypothetical protein